MKTYRKRPPPEVEAIQVGADNRVELKAIPGVELLQEDHILLEADYGPQIIPPGSYLFRYQGTEGWSFMSDRQFEAIYEEYKA